MVSATIAAFVDVGKVWSDIQWFMLSTIKILNYIYIYIFSLSDESILSMCSHLNGHTNIQTILVPELWSTTDVGDVLSFGFCNHCCRRGCGKSLVWYTTVHAFHHEVLNHIYIYTFIIRWIYIIGMFTFEWSDQYPNNTGTRTMIHNTCEECSKFWFLQPLLPSWMWEKSLGIYNGLCFPPWSSYLNIFFLIIKWI